MRVLVVNTGSSSVKLHAVDPDGPVVAAPQLPALDQVDVADVREAIETLGRVDAVGHRVVHGGPEFRQPVLISPDVVERLTALVPLAPLHQPAGLQAIQLVAEATPSLPSVACFDTAFHATIPKSAATYALPREWRDLGVRKYGFHGLAHAWTSRRVAELLGPGTSQRIVTCHLGAGASLASIVDGRSVDTTMGFTPLDGLVMATRSGAVDPGAMIWLLTEAGVSVADLADALDHRSGLLGLAGTTDMEDVIGRSQSGADDARQALDVYLHRLVGSIAAMAAAAGGIDALVFSGGVGEHATVVRQRAADALRFLGVDVDRQRNASARPDCEITGNGAVRVFVIAAREELEIARQVRRVLDNESEEADE